MFLKKLTMFLGLLLILSCKQGNEVKFELGDLVYNGKGCIDGSINLGLSENYKHITIDFNEFFVSATSRRISRMACVISLPITFENGYKLMVKSSPIIGDVSLLKNESIRVTSEIFFAGTQGKKTVNKLEGQITDENIILVGEATTEFTSCEKNSANIRINISAFIKKSSNSNSDSYINLKHMGGSNKNALTFYFKRCK